MSQIVTGEAVALDLRVARIGSRSIALFLDLAIRAALILAMTLLFGSLGVLDDAAGSAVILVLYVSLFLGYPVAFETLWRGRTPGKAAMGLRVVRDDGGPVRFRHALLRGLLGAVVELPGVTLFVAPIIASLVNEQGKRLGDFAAGTMVIQERVPSGSSAIVPMPPPLAAWASTLDLSRVGNDLAMGIRQFFERSGQLSPQARDQLGHALTTSVVAVIAPAPPAGTPAWAILAAVLAERRRRDENRLRQLRQQTGAQQPTWQGPAQPGWGTQGPAQPGWGTPPAAPSWQASAPATGGPSHFSAAPPVPQGPDFGTPPAPQPAPTPVPAPAPLPASEPPAGGFHLPS